MNFTIKCSLGEIIDKITILKLKQQHATQKTQLDHISSELDSLQSDTPLTTINDPLFQQLYTVNNNLWKLEDTIRGKSHLQQFDKEYIQCAEYIHKTNDIRAQIKKNINIKYNSNIVEEKIYNSTETHDHTYLDIIKQKYTKGDYMSANQDIQYLLTKYNNTSLKELFIADLYISYDNICNALNNINMYRNTLDDIVTNIHTYTSNTSFIQSLYTNYCLTLLTYQEYQHADTYLSVYNKIDNLDSEMSFFQEGDVNKTLFIYYMGGIGDLLMFARIIPELCSTYKHNTIKWMINFPNMKWLIDTVCNDIPNLVILYNNSIHETGNFDYHCNLHKVYSFLQYKTYDSIPFIPYLLNINPEPTQKCTQLIDTLTNTTKKNYIFNWSTNVQHSSNAAKRTMELQYAMSLFEVDNINWIITNKDISPQEYEILQKYNNIIVLHDHLDTYDSESTFYDTMTILKYIHGVISTDTSLVHLSLTMDIPTYVLLDIGCDWRWGRQQMTKWYPNAHLIRQTTLRNWDTVIHTLLQIIQ